MAQDGAESKPRWSVAPYFLVDDVVASANYYRDKLDAFNSSGEPLTAAE
jgi:hypothetical protein